MAVEWKKMLLDGDQVDDFTDLDDVPSSYTGEGGKVVKVKSAEDGLEFVTDVGDSDEKVKVSSDDTTPGYLDGKLVGGTAITLTEQTPGGNETLEIKVGDGGIGSAQLGADAVDGTKIADDAVDTEHLAAGAVDTLALGADAVTGDKVADDAIGSEHIEQLSANLDFGGQQAQDMVLHTVADATARDALTPVVGKMVWQTDVLHPHICVSAV